MTGIVSGRDIPDPIRRAVRQRCKFGCVVCGMPIYHYDHIEQFAEVQEHKEENLVLLCPNHHQEKTSRRLSTDRILYLRDNPFNATRETAAGYKFEPNRSLEVMLGDNKARCEFADGDGDHIVIQVELEPMFKIHCRDEWITFSFKLTDAVGNVILAVIDGEMMVNTGMWDYQYEGTHLVVRSGRRQILLDLNLSNQKIHIHRGAFMLPTARGAVVDDGSIMDIFHGMEVMGMQSTISGLNRVGTFLFISHSTATKLGNTSGWGCTSRFG